MSETRHPDILIDQPEDGIAETCGWVEALPHVTEQTAREALAEFCCDEDGRSPFVPTGPAQKKWLYLTNPTEDYEYQRWQVCTLRRRGAVEFWEIVVA